MFGAINIDLLATASGPAVPDDSTPGTLRRYGGGVGRNIAENLARLGCAVSLVSTVGNDEFGRQALVDMQAIGMDVSNVSIQSSASTASYTAVHNNNGDLLHAISDMRLFDEFMLPFEVGHTIDTMQNLVDAADAVVIDANLPATVLDNIATLCHSTMVCADGVSLSKCTKLSSALAAVSLLKVNRAEAIALAGCEFSGEEALLESIHALGPAQVLLTSGEEGAVLSVAGEVHYADVSPDIEVVSTSGAGDAMLSGVIAAALAGKAVDEQLQCGMLVAAETLRVHGACSDKLGCHLLK